MSEATWQAIWHPGNSEYPLPSQQVEVLAGSVVPGFVFVRVGGSGKVLHVHRGALTDFKERASE